MSNPEPPQSIPGIPPGVTKCCICKEPLREGHITEIPMPMIGGNPYPESEWTCDKPECREAANRYGDDLEREYADDDEEDY